MKTQFTMDAANRFASARNVAEQGGIFAAIEFNKRNPDVNTFLFNEHLAKRETLLYSQGFDLVWRLRDSRNAHIGCFNSPALVKQWCDDNGYNCRQS